MCVCVCGGEVASCFGGASCVIVAIPAHMPGAVAALPCVRVPQPLSFPQHCCSCRFAVVMWYARGACCCTQFFLCPLLYLYGFPEVPACACAETGGDVEKNATESLPLCSF